MGFQTFFMFSAEEEELHRERQRAIKFSFAKSRSDRAKTHFSGRVSCSAAKRNEKLRKERGQINFLSAKRGAEDVKNV